MSKKQEPSNVGMRYVLVQDIDGVPEGTSEYVYFEYPDDKKPHKWGIAIIFENGVYEEFSFGVRGRYLEKEKKYKSYAKYDFIHVSKLMDDYNKKYWVWA